jgi:hypothetical protein
LEADLGGGVRAGWLGTLERFQDRFGEKVASSHRNPLHK